ncbi:MAG: biotin/lipoate A/B protein ligase family protein [Candidatus Hadarchaeales archaeon]
MRIRVLPMRRDDAFTSMAIDEALLRLNSNGRSPSTLRFWTWTPSAVSIGFFQSLAREVDLEAAGRYHMQVVRRITGGGAVFHDSEGELTYSFVCSEENVPRDIIESYEIICGGLVSGLRRMGVEADFRPVNDIQVKGRKISGSAQTRRWGSVLQHGTILISPDVRRMFEVLRVGGAKISDKGIESVYDRVTTVEREIKRRPDIKEVREHMIQGFMEVMEAEIFRGDIMEDELRLALELRRKYASVEWNAMR